MEKKKLLLVAISVGIFLAATIGAAILVFTPKNPASSVAVIAYPAPGTGAAAPPPSYQGPVAGSDSAALGPSQGTSMDAVDLVRNPAVVPGLRAPPEGTIRQRDEFYVNGQSGPGRNPETHISVPRPTTVAVPNPTPVEKAAPAPRPVVSTVTQPKPAASAENQPKPAVSTLTQPKPAASTASQSRPSTEARVHNDYWVQTGAFSTETRAEGVKKELASKGINSTVENRDVNGRTMFRVRVGPYTTQNEANYWLSLIKAMSGFEDSQIRQTQSRR